MIAAIPAPKFITKRAGKLLGKLKAKPKTANKKTGSKKSQEGAGSDKNTEKKAESKEAKAEDKGDGVPDPDGGFTADLSKSKAKSRSGHRNAGNKQLHDKMESDPSFRAEMENRHGSDIFDRTSTSGSGRQNPANTEWDHNSTDPSKLDLRTKSNHRQKTSSEGQEGGGWKKFHRESNDNN